jgi:MFS family permease
VTGHLGSALESLTWILTNRSLRRIETAFFGFNLTEYGTWVAILVYAHDATGPASVGIVAVAQLLPAAVYAPIAARIGRRYARTQALVAGYAIIGVSSLAVGAAMAADAPAAVVYASAIVVASAMTMPRPVQAAATPLYADTPEQVTAANAINTMFEGLGVLLGPLAAGILMVVGSPALVFIGGGLVAAGSALLVTNLDVPQAGLPRPDGGRLQHLAALGPTSGSERSSTLDAPPAATRAGGQDLVVLILASRFVVLGALDVLLILLATEALGLAGAGAGFLAAAVGAGGLLGGVLSLVLVGRRSLTTWIVAGAVLTDIALSIIAFKPGFASAIVLLGGGGIGLACLDVAGRTLLQRIGRRDTLAEVFGLVEGLSMLGLAVGSALASLLFTALGLAPALAATAALLPAIAAVGWIRLATVEARLELPVEQIELLRRLPLFAAVPAPSLEAAAGHMASIALPAHSTLFHEGDGGDRFFVIRSGSVEISQRGVPVRTLGPGESFGEIALVRNVARTATATAVTECELWTLEREEFLIAITGSLLAVSDARARADEVLASDRARG